ncbi:hypothetical protein EBZ37_08500 [bacterium]|nr:hypothetical protein [bacterium]
MNKTKLFLALVAFLSLTQAYAGSDRGNMFGIAQSLSKTSDPSTSTLGLDFIYKWNFMWVEVGPTLNAAYVSADGASAWIARAGLQVDLNIFRNMTGNNVVPGVRLLGDYGFQGGSSTEASNVHPTTLGGDVFFKFFPFAFPVAIDLAAGVRQLNSGVSGATAVTSIRQTLGFSFYF